MAIDQTTKLQKDFFENWIGATLCRVDTPEAALRAIGVIKKTEENT